MKRSWRKRGIGSKRNGRHNLDFKYLLGVQQKKKQFTKYTLKEAKENSSFHKSESQRFGGILDKEAQDEGGEKTHKGGKTIHTKGKKQRNG